MSSLDSKSATRYAIYFTPAPDSAHGEFGTRWMGRDAVTGEAVERPSLPGIDDEALSGFLRRPSLYGFHATLKAPFYMSDKRDRDGLVAHLSRFAEARQPFELPAVQPRANGAFVALGSRKRVAAMDSLAADCVRKFEGYRAPLSESDRERRMLAHTLSPRQKSLLEEFGYPFVLDQFDFHMTLAGPLEPKERDQIVKSLSKSYKQLWKQPLLVDAVTLCEQEFGDPFRVTGRFAFGG